MKMLIMRLAESRMSTAEKTRELQYTVSVHFLLFCADKRNTASIVHLVNSCSNTTIRYNPHKRDYTTVVKHK